MTEIITVLVKCQTSPGWGNPARTKTVNVKTGAGSYKFSYAPLDEILDQVRPILAANGLVLSWSVQPGESSPDRVVTVLYHVSGEKLETAVPIITTGNGPQAYGSGLSYACRYGVVTLLGLAGADDDDANMAEGNHYEQINKPRPLKTPPAAVKANYGDKNAETEGRKNMIVTITPGQVEALERELADTGSDVKRFCRLFSVSRLADIPADKFSDALKLIEGKRIKAKDEVAK